GSLDLDEFLGVEVVADGLGGLVTHLEVAQHFRTAQVHVTVGEAEVFVDLVAAGVVERERGRVGDVVNGQAGGIDLDRAGGQVGVGGAFGAGDDRAGDGDDGLGFHVRGAGGELGVVLRVELDLGDALAVAQVDKEDAAVVADGVHPAFEGDGRAEVGGGELGTVMGALHGLGRG